MGKKLGSGYMHILTQNGKEVNPLTPNLKLEPTFELHGFVMTINCSIQWRDVFRLDQQPFFPEPAEKFILA